MAGQIIFWSDQESEDVSVWLLHIYCTSHLSCLEGLKYNLNSETKVLALTKGVNKMKISVLHSISVCLKDCSIGKV